MYVNHLPLQKLYSHMTSEGYLVSTFAQSVLVANGLVPQAAGVLKFG